MIGLLWISALVGLALGLYVKAWIVAPAAAILATSSAVILAQSDQPFWALPICWLGSLTVLELAYLVTSMFPPPAHVSELGGD